MRLTVHNKSRFLVVTPGPVSQPVAPNTTDRFDNVDPLEMSRNAAAWERLRAEGLLDYWVGDDPNLDDEFEVVTASELVRNPVLFIDFVRGDDSGDGSPPRPFLTIQAAMNYAATLAPTLAPGTFSMGVEIRIPPGAIVLTDPLVHHGPNTIILRGTPEVTRIYAPNVAITNTNATPESLAAYRISGLYSDLVNQGNGGGALICENIHFARFSAGPCIELLGVQGDAGPGFTNFPGGRFVRSCVGTTTGVYARNCQYVYDVTSSWWGKHVWVNVGVGIMAYSFLTSVDTIYDSADPEGQPQFGHLWQTAYYCSHAQGITIGGEEPFILLGGQQEAGGLVVNDTATAALYGFAVDGNAVANASATIQHVGGTVNGNLVTAAGASWNARNVHVQGNLTFAAGAGTAKLDGGRYMGVLTDPGGKFVRNAGN